MPRLDIYIASTLIWTFFLSLLVIVGLDLVAAFIDEIASVRENYNTLEILFYLFMTIPSRIYEFIPFGALIGSLLALGHLSNNSELIVMRASGVAIGQIVWAVLKPMLVIAFVAFLLGEMVTPKTDLQAENRRTVMMSGENAGVVQDGVWSREGDTFVHFETVDENKTATGITIFNFDSDRILQSTLWAERGVYSEEQWRLYNVKRTDLLRSETRGMTFDMLEWRTGITPRLLSLDLIEPIKLRISDLFYFINHLSAQGLDSGRFELALWRKIFFPFTLVSLVFVGVSFIFGPLRSGSVGFRIFVGVMTGIVFKVSQDLLGPSSLVFGFPPIFAAILPIFGCVGIGVFFILRTG